MGVDAACAGRTRGQVTGLFTAEASPTVVCVCVCSHGVGRARSYPDVAHFCLCPVTWALAMSLSTGAARTKYHRPEGLTNRYRFLTVLEAGSPRSGCQHGQVLGESPCWDNALAWPSLVCACREGLGVSQGTNPIPRLSPHDLITSQDPTSKHHPRGEWCFTVSVSRGWAWTFSLCTKT